MTTDPLAKARDPLIGAQIDGRYLVQGILGRGGMGVVYDGIHEQLGRPVAIKVLAASISGDPVAVQRFLREAQTASQLTHGNIVDVSDLGVLPDGRPYLVMARIHGTDLATLLEKQGPQKPRRTVELLVGAAAALDLIHAKGFIHRDVKPENLMYVVREDGSETTLLLDFGIVGLVSAQAARLTAEGSVFGTPAYLAPEVIQGALPDRRADVYALATVAFELLTGRAPFEGDNPLHILPKKVLNEPPRLRDVSAIAFAAEIENVIDQGLTRVPEARWATAGEFMEALDAAVADHEEASGEIEPRSRSNTMRRPGAGDRSPQRRTQEVAQPEPTRPGYASAELPVGRASQALADSQLEDVLEANLNPEPAPPPPPPPVATRDATTALIRNTFRTLSTELDASVLAPIRQRRGLRIGVAAAAVFSGLLVAGVFALRDGEPTSSAAPVDAPMPPPAPRPRQSPAMQPEPIPPAAAAEPVAPVTPKVATPPAEKSPKPGRTRASKAESKASVKPLEPEPPPVAPVPKPAGKPSVSSGELVQAAARELIQGHLNAAADLYSQAARIDPKNEAAFRGLGLVNERLGRKTDAIRAFNRALALAPNGQNAAMLRARLAKLQGQ